MNDVSSAPRGATWFHVMNRVAPSRNLLRRSPDARALLELIEAHCVRAGLEIHAYCLLDRHYHLLVRATSDAIPSAIAGLEAACDARFREPRAAAVPLFATKPRVLQVFLGRHLAVVSRYIHLNPVLAGLVWRPEDWPYSSFRAYLGDPRAPVWLRAATVLGQFGGSGARHRYRAFVRAGLDPGARDACGRPRWGTVFARGSLDEELAWRVDPILDWRTTPQAPAEVATRPVPFSVLARFLGEAFAVRPEAVRSWREGGGPQAALARGALVHAARSLGAYRLRDVAAWMRYASPAAAVIAATRFERAARADPALAEKVDDALRAFTARATNRCASTLRGREGP